MENKTNHSEEMRQVMVLMEKMGDDMKLMAEGQSDIRKSVHELEDKVDKGFMEVDNRFVQVFDYLSRIEDELQSIKKDLAENYEKKGHDASWRKQLEDRVSSIEKAISGKALSGAGMIKDEEK